MAYGPGITARLGLDSTDYKRGLQSATTYFQEFVRGTAALSQQGGETSGRRFGTALERSMGLKHALLGLFAALGLNMGAIANEIAEVIAGGTKEGFQRAGEIADRESALIEQKIEAHLGGAKLTEHLQKNLARAIKGPGNASPMGEMISSYVGAVAPGGFVIESWLRSMGIGMTKAEALQKLEEKRVGILEAEAALRDKEKADRAKIVAQEEKEDDLAIGKLKTQDAESYLLKRIVTLTNERLKLGQGTAEWEEKDKQLKATIVKLGEVHDRQVKEDVEHTKEIVALQETRNEKLRAFEIEAAEGDKKAVLMRAELARIDKEIVAAGNDKVRQQELINKKTEVELEYRKQILRAQTARKEEEKELAKAKSDQASLTEVELASIGKFAPGVSLDTEEAAEKNRQQIEIRKKAETARLAGQKTEAEELFAQADTLKSELVKQGVLKSSELPFEQIANKIEETNKELRVLETVFKGKFVAQ